MSAAEEALSAVRECIALLTEGQRQRAGTGRDDIGFAPEDVAKIKGRTASG